MSTIYLPSGGRININCGWHQKAYDNGLVSLYTPDDTQEFLGCIFPGGTVHLTNLCPHSYLPPQTNSLDNAIVLINGNMQRLYHHQLQLLKDNINNYNFKTKQWKQKK